MDVLRFWPKLAVDGEGVRRTAKRARLPGGVIVGGIEGEWRNCRRPLSLCGKIKEVSSVHSFDGSLKIEESTDLYFRAEVHFAGIGVLRDPAHLSGVRDGGEPSFIGQRSERFQLPEKARKHLHFRHEIRRRRNQEVVVELAHAPILNLGKAETVTMRRSRRIRLCDAVDCGGHGGAGALKPCSIDSPQKPLPFETWAQYDREQIRE